MNESEWQIRVIRGRNGNVRRVEGLFALADQIESRFAQARAPVDKPTPSPPAKAWTHSLPARSGCALLLRKILFARSQRAQIRGELVVQGPTNEPAQKLVERIKKSVSIP